MKKVNEKVNGIVLPKIMYESGGAGAFSVPQNIPMNGVTEYLDTLKIRYRINERLRDIELFNAILYPCDENGLFVHGPWDHIEMVIL